MRVASAVLKGKLADGALKNAYAEGTLPTAISVAAAHLHRPHHRDVDGLGVGKSMPITFVNEVGTWKVIQPVGVDGARSVQLILTNVRQRPTVIPLVAFAFFGVIAVAACNSGPPAAAPRTVIDDDRDAAPAAPVSSSPLPRRRP